MIQNSVFFREIDVILNSGTKNAYWKWEAVIHANEKTIQTYYVDMVELERDYLKNMFDVLNVEIALGMGTLEKFVIPYKDKLEVTLRQIPLMEGSNVPNEALPILAFRYRAVLYDNTSGVMTGRNPANKSTDIADNAAIKNIRVQLTDPAVEQIRLKTIGTIFRNTTTANAIRVTLGKFGKNLKNPDNSVAVKGVDVAEGFIPEIKTQIAIPHLTKLVDFPHYVHTQYGGVYNGGFGYYLQNGIWYLFPPFDVTRYQRSKRSLTVINVPADRMPQPERSFRETDNQLIVLATGDVKLTDESESLQLNQGNGVRFADANLLFESFAKTGGNKAVASRGDTTAEFVYQNRATGVNNAQASAKGITANYAVERGKIAARAGSFVQLVWESSRPELLYPGMPTKLMYLENDRAQEVYGNLVHAHAFYVNINQDIKEKRFMCQTAITLFIDRTVKVDDPEYQE